MGDSYLRGHDVNMTFAILLDRRLPHLHVMQRLHLQVSCPVGGHADARDFHAKRKGLNYTFTALALLPEVSAPVACFIKRA